jgi:imidazolonepropionase-like amidohydrolase
VQAIRAVHAFDGEAFRRGGATVLIDGGLVIGVEPYGFQLPDACPVTSHDGTLLPGLIDAHTHLVADSGVSALDRVAGYSDEQIGEVITCALREQLQAGVTTVLDLGDRRFCVVQRRGRQSATHATEPTIVASGPPLTSIAGHCHFLGGEVSGTAEIIRAVAERAQRGVDVVKVMASGGVNTPGSDVMRTQFTTSELRLIVDRAHEAGLPLTAHAHGTPAVEQAIAGGVDGIEHCSCVTDRGFGQVSDETLAALARSQIAVCPTIGVDHRLMKEPPPALKAMLDRTGLTIQQVLQGRRDFVGRLHHAGVRLVSGVDSGIGPAKRHGTLPHAVCELVTAGLSAAERLGHGDLTSRNGMRRRRQQGPTRCGSARRPARCGRRPRDRHDRAAPAECRAAEGRAYHDVRRHHESPRPSTTIHSSSAPRQTLLRKGTRAAA